MATKRTDAFDVHASGNDQRDADIKALKSMSPHSTLKGMGRPVAPLHSKAQGTVPPPISIQDAEDLFLSAETQISRNPLFVAESDVEVLASADDMIELVEESGLLVLEPDQAPDEAIEVSSSFLIDDLDGFPAGLQTHSASNAIEDTEAIEEITSDHLAYIETRGEIVEVDRPRLPTAAEVPLLNRHNLYNESAEYSDGVPRIVAKTPGLSSKTLRVPAPKASQTKHSVLWYFAVTLVFAAGIGAGVFFAMQSNKESAPAEPTAAAAASAPEAADTAVPSLAAAADEAEEAEAADALEVIEPTVQPLDVESLDLDAVVAEQAAELAETEEVTDEVAEELPSGPVVTALPIDPSMDQVLEPLPVKTSTSKRSKSESKAPPASKPAKRETTEAVMDTGSAAPSADPGVLMLAAKPPCEIRINGKTTGLMTPQRVLKLAPGSHRITLTNDEHKIKDSFKVSIVSGQKTRIVRDNTSQIK